MSDSDSRDKVEETRNAMDDLFGDDDDSDQGNRASQDKDGDEIMGNANGVDDSGLSTAERDHRRAMEYAEDEEPEEIHLREANVSIPVVPKPRSSDEKFWVLRLPNFLKIDSRPFHSQTYTGPEDNEEDGGISARERSMSIRLQVENTVRWRWAKDDAGNDIKQSNARIIRWSDGSKTLLMGKEQFEIQETVDTSGAVPRQALSGSQSTTSQPLTAPSRTQGLTYLVAEHAKEAILQAEGPITGTVTLRPIGMHSETHQMLVRAVGQKHNKVARLRMAPDPVRDLEKEKAELLKSQSKKPRQRRDRGEDDLGAPRRRKSYGRRRTSDQYVSDEEGDWGSGGDSDDNITPKKRGGRTKDSGDYQTGDFVVSDEDDEDEEETPRKRKKAREVSDEEDEEEKDVLDEMEEKIEKERAAKKKKRKGPISDAVVDEKEESEEKEEVVEVESEERDDEDEEEERIRRAGTGTRRKRILEEEEE